MDLENYLTTKQAAKYLEITENSVRRLASAGKLDMVKFGYFSLYEKKSIESYKNRAETRGRPKKKKERTNEADKSTDTPK